MRILRFSVATLLLSVPAPAFADRYFAVTPSGAAEMLFADPPATVTGRLSSRCIDLKWTVVSSSASEYSRPFDKSLLPSQASSKRACSRWTASSSLIPSGQFVAVTWADCALKSYFSSPRVQDLSGWPILKVDHFAADCLLSATSRRSAMRPINDGYWPEPDRPLPRCLVVFSVILSAWSPASAIPSHRAAFLHIARSPVRDVRATEDRGGLVKRSWTCLASCAKGSVLG